MVDFPEDRTLQPGSWYLWTTGRERVFLACPLCGQVISVEPSEVEIFHDGRLSKIIDCPNPICDFTDAVRLLGWRDQGSPGNPTGT